jgi:hypothetical protein
MTSVNTGTSVSSVGIFVGTGLWCTSNYCVRVTSTLKDVLEFQQDIQHACCFKWQDTRLKFQNIYFFFTSARFQFEAPDIVQIAPYDRSPEEEYRYSHTLYLTSFLGGMGDQRHTPAALPPGKSRYPLYRKMGGPQGQSGQVRKISPPPGFDPRTVHSVVSLAYFNISNICVFE